MARIAVDRRLVGCLGLFEVQSKDVTCGGGLGRRHAERAAQCDGAQRIGRAERAGGHDLDVGRFTRVYAVKVNAEGGLAAVLCQILPVIVEVLLMTKYRLFLII